MRPLTVHSFSRDRSQIAYTARIADLQFTTSIWYDSVDLLELEQRFGEDLLRRIYFHIVAFDVNRLVSLKPDTIDFGPFQDLVTPRFASLWTEIVDRVWSQWRYENTLPEYPGPTLTPTATEEPRAISLPPSDGPRSLSFCGGGKDSLVGMRLLEDAGEPYDVLVYSHSIYGLHDRQHRIVDSLLAHAQAKRRHGLWIQDDFFGVPVLERRPDLGIRTLCAAETPSSVMNALPIALAHSLHHLIVAHEKSADAGNLIWDATGEEVNHQWGKSLEAEQLLSSYVHEHLITDVTYCSVLKPIHDPVIFSALTAAGDAALATHSCNIEKPWCETCAKCAYVWLNYCAYLPQETVERIFKSNLFDRDENQLWFRQMLGLEDHTPFECVGQVDEAHLAFELCRVRGYDGQAMDLYAQHFDGPPDTAAVDALFHVDRDHQLLPADLASRILPLLEKHAQNGKLWMREQLSVKA